MSDFTLTHSLSFSTARTSTRTVVTSLSPVMRKLEDMQRKFEETMEDRDRENKQLKEALLEVTHNMTTAARGVAPSPLRRSPRLQQDKENIAADDTIVSGPMFSAARRKMRGEKDAGKSPLLGTPRVLCDITNKRKSNHARMVADTASPDLAKKKEEPTAEEMAKKMGVNLDSPSLNFTCSRRKTSADDVGKTPRAAKRSVRRTTMIRTELTESLRGIRVRIRLINELFTIKTFN